MAVNVLPPSIEQRMWSFNEVMRRATLLKPDALPKPTITIAREFGCEAYPVAEELLQLVKERTGEEWVIVDKALFSAVAKDHSLSEDILRGLGQKPRWLDEMFATLSPGWKSEAGYSELIANQIASVAMAGNAIFVGLGAAIITKSLKNCHHFRLVADKEFKIRSISRRLGISRQETELLIVERQKERDRILRSLLDADAHDPLYYHMIFNNAKVRNGKIAQTIADFVLG
jgi:Cytidylate kinase-like family